MNIAVLGKNRINEMLQSESEKYGFTISVLTDIGLIRSISGSRGAFAIKSANGVLDASYIVVTEPLTESGGIMSQKGALLLENDAEVDRLPYGRLPVAFILDYPLDSSAQTARKALEKAVGLTLRKHSVVYLTKNIRTAGDGLENLYRKARSMGVLFFKYDQICIESFGNGLFHIKLNEKGGGMELDTQTAIFAGNKDRDGTYEKLVKLLRIKTETDGSKNASGFYLFPSQTSRKGIYFINTNAASGSDGELLAQVRFILSDIRRDMWNCAAAPALRILVNPDGYAEVDAEKCAFCYTCYRACPHAAMAPDNEKSAMKNLRESCMGCGICTSVCPANAIAMERKKENGASPVLNAINVFCCANSGELAQKKIAESIKDSGITVTVTRMPCGGEISVESILLALKEAAHVLVAVCMDGACRNSEGNKRAKRQVERARGMLKDLGLDENKVSYLQLSHAMPMVLEEYIRDIARKTQEGMVL